MRDLYPALTLTLILGCVQGCSLGDFDRTEFGCPCEEGETCVGGRCVPRSDAGVEDAGSDSGFDGGPNDGGPNDGGPNDGGPNDGGSCAFNDFFLHYGPIAPVNGVGWENEVGGFDGTCEDCPTRAAGSPGFAFFEGGWKGVQSTPIFGEQGGTIMFVADPFMAQDSSLFSMITEGADETEWNIFQVELSDRLDAFVSLTEPSSARRHVYVDNDDAGVTLLEHHWALTWGPDSNPELYLDGVRIQQWEGEGLGRLFTDQINNNVLVVVGGDINSGEPVLPFVGDIGHVRMFNRPVEPCTIELYSTQDRRPR